MKLYLFDIEGTTSDSNFVHKILFPYSKKRISDFLMENLYEPEVTKALNEAKELVRKEEHIQLSNYEVINRLEQWIDQDRKISPLKEIQGMIWKSGYEKGDFKSHFYDDVKPLFEKLQKAGVKIGTFSSGSVQTQKLIFAHSLAGDLNPFISYYFDTKIGSQREKSSYRKIAQEVNLPEAEILFFSDHPQELAAAKEAGFQVKHVQRPGTNQADFPSIHNFSEIKVQAMGGAQK